MRSRSNDFHALPPQKTHRGRGVTLVEALFASVILAIATAAITQAVSAGQMQTYDALKRQRAVELAEALMDEVLSLPYCDPQDAVCGTSAPGLEPGESGRSTWDNADDCHAHSEAAGALQDFTGVAYPAEYQGFTRSASAAYGNVSVTGYGSAIPGLTLTVTVQNAAGAAWTLTRFKAKPQA